MLAALSFTPLIGWLWLRRPLRARRGIGLRGHSVQDQPGASCWSVLPRPSCCFGPLPVARALKSLGRRLASALSRRSPPPSWRSGASCTDTSRPWSTTSPIRATCSGATGRPDRDPRSHQGCCGGCGKPASRSPVVAVIFLAVGVLAVRALRGGTSSERGVRASPRLCGCSRPCSWSATVATSVTLH